MDLPGDLDARRFSAARPPAVLLGGLNVLRALGRGGIPVIVASSSSDEAAFASLYCRGRLRLPALDDRRAVADRLLRLGESLAHALGRRLPLFYSNDDWQRLVQDYRSELMQHYTLLLNEPGVARAVIDKDLFQSLAAARGLPIPRIVDWDMLERFAGPVLVKPRTKFAADVSAVYSQLFAPQGKARIFPNGRALFTNEAARRMRGQLLIQEYVEGGDSHIWSFHGFADE
ncbi:MAG TPA: hypothetical protein VMN03_06160, partial [Burkholderiales bacterium]|nr:hypothetical protein [Burkholderiales bacterium]